MECAEKVRILTKYNPTSMEIATRRDAVLPLHMAASNENSSCLQMFLSHGNTSQLVNATTKKGYTCLHISAALGLYKNVRQLLQSSRIGVNAKTRLGDTAVHLAAHARNWKSLMAIAKHPGYETCIQNRHLRTVEDYMPKSI